MLLFEDGILKATLYATWHVLVSKVNSNRRLCATKLGWKLRNCATFHYYAVAFQQFCMRLLNTTPTYWLYIIRSSFELKTQINFRGCCEWLESSFLHFSLTEFNEKNNSKPKEFFFYKYAQLYFLKSSIQFLNTVLIFCKNLIQQTEFNL